MSEFRVSKKAKKDIDDIYKYTMQNWSLDQADRYFKLLQKEMNFASNNPELGRRYLNIDADLFGVKNFE